MQVLCTFKLAAKTVINYFPCACAKANITGLRLHNLRHEATSRFFARGFNVMQVASITRRTALARLKRYTHLSSQDLGDTL
jgi:site-specific recombinase XerD